MPETLKPDIPALFRVAPSAVIAAFGIGLMNGPVIALTPVFGVHTGMSPTLAAVLLLALQGGSLLGQWPVGWLSDHIDRRVVLVGLAIATSLTSVLIVWGSATGSSWSVVLGFALWGGSALCIYAVCIAHASDVVEPSRIVPTISTLSICWALGMMAGPLLAAAFMERVGAHGLFVYSGIIATVIAAFVIIRIVVRTRVPVPGGFIDIPPTSPAFSELRRQDQKGLDGGH
jgi:MFS family permease